MKIENKTKNIILIVSFTIVILGSIGIIIASMIKHSDTQNIKTKNISKNLDQNGQAIVNESSNINITDSVEIEDETSDLKEAETTENSEDTPISENTDPIENNSDTSNTTNPIEDTTNDSSEFINVDFNTCNLAFTFDKTKYNYTEGTYRQYLGSQSKGEARFQQISSNSGNGNVNEEVVIECGSKLISAESNNDLLQGLKERWDNEGITYSVDIIDQNKTIGQYNYLVIDYTFNSEAMGETTERIYLLSNNRSYIIRVTSESNTDTILSEIGLTIKK